ncbi:DUF6197 family protein [Streptomyces sp. UNOB3_S3]|uniref:DUF6197 family protein n=1 Tax=Streptomyces sp. UNOB3_S3 TaxID=2871682 RepID=UPI001E2CDB4F|nr:DUF6197 family protein [Streptomyces sp. UNOB3_S3]MCC3773658.1 Lsr2 family protein [Streptomyces sp. UNOB3_S3]
MLSEAQYKIVQRASWGLLRVQYEMGSSVVRSYSREVDHRITGIKGERRGAVRKDSVEKLIREGLLTREGTGFHVRLTDSGRAALAAYESPQETMAEPDSEPEESEPTATEDQEPTPAPEELSGSVTLKWSKQPGGWGVTASWCDMFFWVLQKKGRFYVSRTRERHDRPSEWSRRVKGHGDMRTRQDAEAAMIAHIRKRQTAEAEYLREIAEAEKRNAPVWVSTLDKGPFKAPRRMRPEKVVAEWGDAVTFEVIEETPEEPQKQMEPAPVAPWRDAVPGEPVDVETSEGTVQVRYAGYDRECRWEHCGCDDDACSCPPRPVMLCDGESQPYAWEACPECMAGMLLVSADVILAALPSATAAGSAELRHPPLVGPLRMSLVWQVEELEPGYERVVFLGQEFRLLSDGVGRYQFFTAAGQRLCGPLAWAPRETALSNIESFAFAGVPREALRLVRLNEETRVHCVMCEPGFAWGRDKSAKAVVEIAGAGEVFVCDGPFHLGILGLVPDEYTDGLSPDAERAALAQYTAWVGGQGERPLTVAERGAQPRRKAARAAKRKNTVGQAGAQAMETGNKHVKAPKVSDITFDGDKGRELAELLGHTYRVTMLAGTYDAVHVASGERVCRYEKSRPVMKRAILADAVERGQRQTDGVVVKVAAPSVVVETTREESVSEYGWEQYGQRFAVGDVVCSGHPRAEGDTGVVVSVRERGDGEQIAGVRWDGRAVSYEQWSGTLVSVPVTVVERAEGPQALTNAPAPTADLTDVVDAEIVEEQPQRVPLSYADLEGKALGDFAAPEDLADLERLAGVWPVRWLFEGKRRAVNQFGGCGGWCVGIREILGADLDMVCIDLSADAVATSEAAGCNAIQADVTTLDPEHPALRWTEFLISSPPCTDWTPAGKRLGHLPENLAVLEEAINRAAWAAGNYEWGETGEEDEDHPDWDPEFPPHYGPPSGETWDEVRAITDAMTAPTAKLMLEPVIWALALWRQGAPLHTIALEQSGALPEDVQEALSTELYSAGWECVDWAEVDAADLGSPSHRRRRLMLASRYYNRRMPELPGLTTTGDTATGLDPEAVVITRGNRKTSGGNGFSMGRTVPGITSKIRGWYKQDDPEFRFTLGQVAKLVTLPADYPFTGSRTSACQQAADIVAPVVSAAVMGTLLGVPWLPSLERYLGELYPDVHGTPAAEPVDTGEEEHQDDGPTVRYTPNSVMVPDTAPEILRWAACHIENVGLHQGRGLFNGPGRTVTLACHPRGAVSVAAGRGRFAAGRTYDHDAIWAAEREALRLLAEHVTGQPMELLTDSAAVRACYWRPVDKWGMAEGRTAAEVADVLRAVAAGAAPAADTGEIPAQAPAGDGGKDSSLADTEESEDPRAKMDLLPGEEIVGYRGGWHGEYEVKVPGGTYTYALRDLGASKRGTANNGWRYSLRCYTDGGRIGTDDVKPFKAVPYPADIMPAIRKHAAKQQKAKEQTVRSGEQPEGSLAERLRAEIEAQPKPGRMAALLTKHYGPDWRPLDTGYAGTEGREFGDADEEEPQVAVRGIAQVSSAARAAAWRLAAGKSRPDREPEPEAGEAPQDFLLADTTQDQENTVKVPMKETVGGRLRQVRPARQKLAAVRQTAVRRVREVLPPAAARAREAGQRIAQTVRARLDKPTVVPTSYRAPVGLNVQQPPASATGATVPASVEPVEPTFCDAHVARDGSQVEATTMLSLGERDWDLCDEHAEKFAGLLVEALGEPGHDNTPPSADVQDDQLAPATDEVADDQEHGVEGDGDDLDVHEQASVMICGEVPGYSWDDARDAVRNAGYRVAGRADETTVLIICGRNAENNATKLRDARERGIPCMDATRPGRFKNAVLSGEFTGGDRLPEPVKAIGSGMSEREKNDRIREWGRSQGYELKDRGRLPQNVRVAYDQAHELQAA